MAQFSKRRAQIRDSSVIADVVGDWNRDGFCAALGSRPTTMSFASFGSQQEDGGGERRHRRLGVRTRTTDATVNSGRRIKNYIAEAVIVLEATYGLLMIHELAASAIRCFPESQSVATRS